MRTGLVLAAALTLLAAPAALADPPKPTLTVQVQPVGRLLDDTRTLLRSAAGEDGDAVVKKFNAKLKEQIGEKGFEGLDLNRPLGLYVVVADPVQKSTVVLVVPYTTEAEFVGLLGRMKVKATPKGKKGGYTFAPEGMGNEFPGRLTDGWAYIAVLGGDAAVETANLVSPDDVFDKDEKGQLSARFHPDRFPAAVLKDWLDPPRR